MATNQYERESHVTFFPNTNVDFIRISKDTTKTISAAVAGKSDPMTIDTVLLTKFGEGKINASYFATEDAAKSVFTIYKKTPYQQYYQYVCTLDKDYELTDYNIISNQFYHYLISVEIPNGAAGGGSEYLFYENTDVEGEANYYYVKFDSWTICDIEATDDENIYVKTGRIWELGLNLENEDLTVNTSVTAWDTLGKYPKFSIGQKKYQSMSFTSLLGKMFEYDAYSFTNEEGVSSATVNKTYQYTEKLDTYNNKAINDSSTEKDDRWNVWREYARESDKLEAWNKFISNGSLKLLRDIKGNAWVLQVADSTSYNINSISSLQQTAVTFQWKEALDASNKSIVFFGDTTEVD